jgi:protein-tyrosine-phosphatase
MTDKILFVCVENAGRSIMAEAFFNKYAPKNFQPLSAGTKPASQVNPTVIQVMKEVGIDISLKKPQTLSKKMISKSKKTVNMGCMDKESCPALFSNNVIDWQIPEPKGKSIEEIRKIRNQIDSKVKELVSNLTAESSCTNQTL